MRRIAALSGALVAAMWASASAATLPVEPVTACIARNAPQRTSLQTIEMRARDRIGSERSIRSKVYWKRFDDGLSKVLAHFSEPVDIDGARLLMLEKPERNEMFLYMPAVRKVRRISSQSLKGNIFGTDFSYEDFERLQGLAGSIEPERLEDSALDGRPVYVIAARTPEGVVSAYDRTVSYVDRETCVPLKVEFFEPGDRLRKVLEVDPEKVRLVGEQWLPHELVLRDLRDATETRLVVEQVEVGLEIPDRTFSVTKLERSR